jgi:hypothetical protein
MDSKCGLMAAISGWNFWLAIIFPLRIRELAFGVLAISLTQVQKEWRAAYKDVQVNIIVISQQLISLHVDTVTDLWFQCKV